MKKLVIALFLSLFLFTSVNAMTLAWDAYTDPAATNLRIEASTDNITWNIEVDSIETSIVASDVPNGPDSTRIWYRLRAYNTNTQEQSDPSNVVSYFWTTGGGGFEGVAPVDGVRLLDCDEIILDDQHPDYDTCLNRNTLSGS